jgi:hypothetical protein
MNIHYDYMFPMSEEREMHAFLKHNQAPLYWALASQGPSQAAEARKSFEDLA